MYSIEGDEVKTSESSKSYSYLTKTWADLVETSFFTFPRSIKEINLDQSKVYKYSNLASYVKFNAKDTPPITLPQ